MYDSYTTYYTTTQAPSSGISQLEAILTLVAVVIMALSYWVIFKKADKPGWPAFVPFAQQYILSEITFGNGLFFLLTFVPVLGPIYLLALNFKLASVFNRSTLFGFGLAVFPYIFLPILALSSDSYYTGAGMTSGSFISNSRVPSNYGDKYYNQPKEKQYDDNAFYGSENSSDDNAYYVQDNSVNNNNSYYSQNNNTSNYDGYYGQNNNASNYDGYYGQNNSTNNNNGYYNQNNNQF